MKPIKKLKSPVEYCMPAILEECELNNDLPHIPDLLDEIREKLNELIDRVNELASSKAKEVILDEP